MDPLLLEVLRFGTAILAGGLVAVIAQRIAFRHARQLQLEGLAHRDAGLRRALISEVEENIARIGNENELELRYPLSIGRSSWDLAREIELPPALQEVLNRAYALAERLNDNVATANAYYAGRNARAIAKQAREAFERADQELKPVTPYAARPGASLRGCRVFALP